MRCGENVPREAERAQLWEGKEVEVKEVEKAKENRGAVARFCDAFRRQGRSRTGQYKKRVQASKAAAELPPPN